MKLEIANPSMISSSCELDSLLFLLGVRGGALVEAAGCGAFLAASLPGLCPSLSEQEELGSGLQRASLLPASLNLRTLSRLVRHLRPVPCFNFPSMLLREVKHWTITTPQYVRKRSQNTHTRTRNCTLCYNVKMYVCLNSKYSLVALSDLEYKPPQSPLR